MLPFTGFLLSLQAAGMIFSFNDINQREQYLKEGRELQQAAFETNMEAINLEANQASLEDMRRLQANLSKQIALNATNSFRSGEGAVANIEKSISAFGEDERIRRMNLLAKESELRANNVLSGQHVLQAETELGKQRLNVLSQLPISAGFESIRKGAKKAGFGLEEM